MTRIAVVAASLGILGGQGVQANALVRELGAEGHEILFVPIDAELPRSVARVRAIPVVRTLVNQAFYWPSLRRLRRVEVVHVFSASYWSFLLGPLPAMLIARLYGKRVILNYHSGEAADHLDRWGALVHPWLRLADEIVVPSRYLAEIFARHGHAARVVRNIVDLGRFCYRSRERIDPRLISTRNLEPWYRVDNTIRAFASLRDRVPDATLTIVGYGSEEANLKALAGSLGDRGIRFLGRVEPDRLPEVLDAADVFVNSSIVDNQPVSILEAFAAGLSVVTTPTGGIAELVRDGETGVVVPPENPAAMAAALERLLGRPDAARGMAERARKEVEDYTWPRVREGWLAAYDGVGR